MPVPERRGLRRPCQATIWLIIGIGCHEASAPSPPPNVRVTVTPAIVASFASLGGMHTISALVTDTLGAARDETVTWDVSPAAGGVSVDQGAVTVSPNAAAGDYRVRASVLGISDTAMLRVLPRPTGKLVFTASVGADRQVFVKDFATSGDAIQITTGAGAPGGLAVHPATGTIIVSRGILPSVDLFRMDIDGSNVVNLTNDPTASNQGPTVHPISGDIYFTRRGLAGGPVAQVFRMAPDGSALTEVSSGSQTKTHPAISPNGLLLSWTELYPGFNNEVVTASILGENAVRFTDRAGADGQPFWISNTRLAWAGALTTAPDIFVADVPGGGPNALNLTNRAGSSSQPTAGCSPGTITIVRVVGPETDVYQLDLTTALAVKYTLPVSRSIGFARRLC